MNGEDEMMMKIDVEVELLSFPVLWFRVGPRKEAQPSSRATTAVQTSPFYPLFSGRLSGVSRNLALFAFVLSVSDILQSHPASSFVDGGPTACFLVLIYQQAYMLTSVTSFN